jgi:hypothetical protein
VQCAPASVVGALESGAPVCIDEGRLEARVVVATRDGAVAEVTRKHPGGVAL